MYKVMGLFVQGMGFLPPTFIEFVEGVRNVIINEYTGVKSIEFLKGMELPEEGLFREVEDFYQCGGCFAGALPQGLHRLAVAALRAAARDRRVLSACQKWSPAPLPSLRWRHLLRPLHHAA